MPDTGGQQAGRNRVAHRPRPARPRPGRVPVGQPGRERGVAGGTRLFATLVPGLAQVFREALEGLDGVSVDGWGFDGRADIVLFTAGRGADGAEGLGLTEDLFAEVGRTLRSEGDDPGWIAGRIWRPARAERALSVWGARVRPLRAAMTYRVIARVLQERSFQRTDLRRHLTEAIGRSRPRWKVADPADLEVWACEYTAGRFVAGLRLSDVRMRQHDGRAAERPGALRPTVAAAMVRLAGPPGGLLADPCCGSGTILAEAIGADWDAWGADIDPDAVRAARRNVPGARVSAGDVRSMELPDASAGACVSNLPFGQQYHVQGDMTDWLRSAAAEVERVTRPGGRAVLLTPDLPRVVLPPGLTVRERYPIRLLGTRTTIWACDRS